MALLINLLGIDGESASALLKNSAKRLGASFSAGDHIGGWALISADERYARFATEAAASFPKAFLGDPFEFAVSKLKAAGAKVTCAESCTGGLLAAGFTAVSGSSAVFDGSLVTYSNRLKSRWLNVSQDTLSRYGAVSEECVLEMALGAISVSGADYALAVSGIAGPDGGSKSKPVGTVFISIADKNGAIAERLLLNGSRREIQTASVYNALRLLLNAL